VRAGGVSSPFYRGRGALERGGHGGVTTALMAFNAIEDGGKVKRGLRGGNDGGRVMARAAFEGEVGWRGVVGDDEEKQQRSASVRKGMELTGGPHMAVM
jgi:hypothetical protein